jgi:hypothetical protein
MSYAVYTVYGICSDTWYTSCDPLSSPNQSMAFESSFVSSSSNALFFNRSQHLILARRMSCLRVLQIFVRRILNDKLGRTWSEILLDTSSTSPRSDSGCGYNSKSELCNMLSGLVSADTNKA